MNSGKARDTLATRALPSTRGWHAQLAVALVAGLVSGGCVSWIDAYPDSNPSEKAGVRYYLPASFLVVERKCNGLSADDKTGADVKEIPDDSYSCQWDARFQTLPDTTRRYRVQPRHVLAAYEATIELNDDGTLKSVTLNQDATQVSEAVVNGVKEISLKKLDLVKTKAEAAAGRTTTETRKTGRDVSAVRVWTFRISGTRVQEPSDAPMTFGTAGSSAPPTGTVEGTFSIPVGPSQVDKK